MALIGEDGKFRKRTRGEKKALELFDTGAGKSSIMNLIARFYDYQGGKITIDGRELKEYSIASLRGQTGIVLQDSFLFDGTVRDNIQYGRLEATGEEIEKVAGIIEADEFIALLEGKPEDEIQSEGIDASPFSTHVLAPYPNRCVTLIQLGEESLNAKTRYEFQSGLEAVAPRQLAEDDLGAAGGPADVGGVHDLVGLTHLQDAVLMDARLVSE